MPNLNKINSLLYGISINRQSQYSARNCGKQAVPLRWSLSVSLNQTCTQTTSCGAFGLFCLYYLGNQETYGGTGVEHKMRCTTFTLNIFRFYKYLVEPSKGYMKAKLMQVLIHLAKYFWPIFNP